VLRDALDALANGTRSEPFHLLAAIVPAELVGGLVDAARAIEHPYQRSAALIGVIDRLPPDGRARVVAEVEADTELTEDQCTQLLAQAARHLSPEQLRQLVAAVRAIEWDSGRSPRCRGVVAVSADHCMLARRFRKVPTWLDAGSARRGTSPKTRTWARPMSRQLVGPPQPQDAVSAIELMDAIPDGGFTSPPCESRVR
jgi:hypothetical protein